MASIPPGSALATTTAPGTTLSLQVSSVDDLQRLARLFAASGLFGRGGNPDAQLAQCAVTLLAGLEIGISPYQSISNIHLINGKPGFSAQLLAQAIKKHPRYDYRVLEKTATACRIQFLEAGQELGVEVFTAEMAERAGLLKNPTWRQYPEAMLFARALTAGMRTHCPDALGGHTAYTSGLMPLLASLAKSGISPESAERWNTAAEPADDPDDLPLSWITAEPASA